MTTNRAPQQPQNGDCSSKQETGITREGMQALVLSYIVMLLCLFINIGSMTQLRESWNIASGLILRTQALTSYSAWCWMQPGLGNKLALIFEKH
jgi:hypothetical protein